MMDMTDDYGYLERDIQQRWEQEFSPSTTVFRFV